MVKPPRIAEAPVCIGVNALPKDVRNSYVLTGNDLGMLGNLTSIPSEEEIDLMRAHPLVKELFDATIGDANNRQRELHELAKEMLGAGQVADALKIVLLEV